ncbi:MAG: aminoglycoside phosphotransferase family protein [Ruminococcus sp.]|nr:aminoglycoside phosphotransferase family protein [Ruminococcus sp.]
MLTEKLPELFGLSGNFSLTELGSGHINRTFLVTAADGCRYILQSLNSDIFRSPEKVMENISAAEAALAGCQDIKIPHYLRSGGRNYIRSGDDIWRMYAYCESSGKADLCSAGYAYGSFIRMLSSSGIAPEPVIDGYHDFAAYMKKLSDVCPQGKLPPQITELAELSAEELPTRVIHGDAKLDNIIISSPCTVIDLDTIMTATAAIDYGDLIRSVCTGGISLAAVREVTEGFADGLAGMLSAAEVSSLYSGILLVTGELAVRYFTDYYSSERYFRNKTREQCLSRSSELLRQLEEFKAAETDIRSIISTAFKA